MPERLATAVALAVVGIAVLVGSLAIADGIRDRGRRDVLTVTGSAKRRIQSDYVVGTASLTSRQPTAQAAAKELTQLPSLRPALLEDATKDALARAEVLARATDVDLGSVRSVNVGVFQVTSPNSTELSDYGVYDIRHVRRT